MNLFKRPRKVKFPAHEGSQTYALNRRPTTMLAPGQKPTIPGQRATDQRAADYLNAIPDVDDEHTLWIPFGQHVPSDVPADIPDVSTWPGIRDQQTAEYLNAAPITPEEMADMFNIKTVSRSWEPSFPPETLALFERIRSRNIKEHGTPHARVVKRDGYWISIVYGSDGAAVLYDEVFATTREHGIHNGWQEMMTAADEDMATVRRIEAAGHRLPEAENPTHY